MLYVLPIPCAPRMQSSLDSGTPSQFGFNKGVLQSTLRARAFWLAALHIKQTGLSVSAQAVATKSVSPAWNTEEPQCGVLHRERLTTNSEHGPSAHVSDEPLISEGEFGQIRVSPSTVSKNNLCHRCSKQIKHDASEVRCWTFRCCYAQFKNGDLVMVI